MDLNENFSSHQWDTHGDSAFNPVVVSLELLRAGDVERNPGDTTTSQTQIELPNKGLRIGHWNVEHLTDSKFEQISLLLTTCKKIDILFLQETFLNATKPDSVYNIPGYILHRRDRENKSGGGLLAYVVEGIKAKRNYHLEDGSVESLWLNVCPYKSVTSHRHFVSTTIYITGLGYANRKSN